MRAQAHWIQRQLHRAGFEVVRYPSKSVQSLSGHTANVLEELSIDCVLDVGANIGQYGQFLRSLGYQHRIVSFEPVTETYHRLLSVVEQDNNWWAANFALGSEDQYRSINVTLSSTMASLRSPSSRMPQWMRPQLEILQQPTVRVARLDSVFSEFAPMDARVFLKIDTQGWDLEVVKGALESLHHVQAVQIEVSVIPIYDGMPTWLDSLGLLSDLGFQPTWMSPVVRDGPIAAVEFDCVMIRSSSREAAHERP